MNYNISGIKSVLITGGGGYVGSALVPKLLYLGYKVKVVDLFWYGDRFFNHLKGNPNLQLIKLDIRNTAELSKHIKDVEAVIHLACISNDPSFELNPQLGKSINYDCFPGIVQSALDGGVKRFILASSASVYGIKNELEVTENSIPEPLTDYSKYKLLCEKILLEKSHLMEVFIVRPATVCGYAPRLRLDLVVNILTINALVNGKIIVLGGKQKRPSIHIKDMVRTYTTLLEVEKDSTHGDIFNAGGENHTVEELAHLIRDYLGNDTIIENIPSNDNRSYHVNSNKIKECLGLDLEYNIRDAISGLAYHYNAGDIKDPLNNSIYHNIKMMNHLQIK